MPYDIIKSGSKFIVQKADGSKRFGTHDSEADAKKQLAALNIAEQRGAESRVAESVAESRSLHLLGATGLAKTVVEGVKEWLVVPVVALMEGVIHAVNAETPEFVPTSTLKQAAESWNGKPITIGHPKRDGKQCSAQDAKIIASVGIGEIRNSRVEGTKLLQEAWIEKAKAKQLHPDMFARLSDGGTEEVSVGAMVVTDKKGGTHANGKKYLGSWTFADGDHLAFLPGGRGACSAEMGCGTNRAAMRVCEDHLEDVVEEKRVAAAGDDAEEQAELIAYQSMRTVLDGVDGQFEKISELVDALIADETESPAESDDEEAAEEQVETARLDAIRMMAQALSSALNAVISATYCQSLSDSPRYMAALAGARHSVKDMSAIQAVHDHAMALGAQCDRSNYKMLEEAAAELEGKLEHDKLKLKVLKMDDPTRNYIESVKQRAAR
jgi:hypothetical protein